jgi:hypothetical protein
VLTNNKDLKWLLREAEAEGWMFEKRERHIRGKHPNGQTATISISPSDRRALMNIKRDLKVRQRT